GSLLLSQIKRFANDIQAGDVIVTKNEGGGYDVGICVDSHAYIDNAPVEIPRENDESPKEPALRYKFRKKVVWGPSIDRSSLPQTVRRATRGQQTISNLSAHRVKIFHLIYPFFTDGENLYFSNKIKKQGDINALVIGKLFENVSLAEKLIQELTDDSELDISKLISQLNKDIFSLDSFVACQAEFMSPGDMWCKIPLSQVKELVPQLTAGVLVCLLLTGQVEAADIDNLSSIPPTATAVLQVNENSPSTAMFKEKFEGAKRSTALKEFSEKLKRKQAELEKLEEKRSTKEVRENLRLEVTSTKTEKLEKFNYGINIIELRGLNEGN
ncbi:TPA: hypothetical protein VDU00_005991, partial [Pseudomonas aeruginosa]|nr:hypothetical protein [Pseudomonas aeruginosa]